VVCCEGFPLDCVWPRHTHCQQGVQALPVGAHELQSDYHFSEAFGAEIRYPM
jgi:hypothetical protein